MKRIFKLLCLAVLLTGFSSEAFSQKKPVRKKTTKSKTTAKVAPTPIVDTTSQVAAAPAPLNDSLPLRPVLRSLRNDYGVDYSTREVKDRTPLPYEHLRVDDAVYRQRVWREIDTREKLNHTFNYSADEDNGNQRFISILMQAIQDSAVTVFSSVDDRFTTPMSKAEVRKHLVEKKLMFRSMMSLVYKQE